VSNTSVVTDENELRENKAYSVACPTCGAAPGHRCTKPGGYLRDYTHLSRENAGYAWKQAKSADPNPEITALREFVKVTKPLEGMIRLYVNSGNINSHVVYALAMLNALEVAESSLKAIDTLIANFPNTDFPGGEQ